MSGEGTSRYWTFMRVVLALVMVTALAPFAWYIWNRGYQRDYLPVPAAAGIDQSHVASVVLNADGYNDADLRVHPNQLVLAQGFRNEIAALSYTETLQAQDVQFLRGRDRVIVVEINGETRAYPTRLLNYHELVNDTLGGVPMAVIYCPLTDSVSVVDRRVAGRTLTFGVTSRLLNSNVVFFDETDHALWSQIGLGAISGPLAGTDLTHINTWRIETFERYRDEQPFGLVLSDYTGQVRNYGDNPYRNYYFEDQIVYPVAARDDSIPPKTRIVAVAYPDGRRVAYLLGDRDGELRDGELHVRMDRDTRSMEVVSAPQGAAVLRACYFAWYAFYPDTEVVER